MDLRTLCGVVFILVSSRSVGSTQGPVLIGKCCDDESELNRFFDRCDRIKERTGGSNGAPRRAFDVRTEDRPNYPWWMDNKTSTICSRKYVKMNWFLPRDNSSAVIEYGKITACRFHRLIYSNDKNYDLMNNGTLIVYPSELQPNRLSIPPRAYCADVSRAADGSRRFVFRLCPCDNMQCVVKCCPLEWILSQKKSESPDCTRDSTDSEKVELLGIPDRYREDVSRTLYLGDSPSLPQCGAGEVRAMLLDDTDRARFMVRGDLSVSVQVMFTDPFELGSGRYCMDAVGGRRGNFSLVYCRRVDGVVLAATVYLLGCVLCAATLGVYALLPEVRSVYHSTLASHTGSQLLVYLALAAEKILPRVMDAESNNVCQALGMVVYFAELASFFWLNVMCFDIAWTFRNLQPVDRRTAGNDCKKYLLYSLYAWGCPCAFTAVTAAMQFAEGISKVVPTPELQSSDSAKGCWFNEWMPFLIYLYGPIVFLLLVNLVFFSYTITRIIRLNKSTAILQTALCYQQDGFWVAFKKHKNSVKIYGKLFLLMGLSKTVEVIFLKEEIRSYWYYSRLLNLARAFFIFHTMCCKKDVRRLLMARVTGARLVEHYKGWERTNHR